MGIRINYEYVLWTSVKAHCPICKKTFTGWYCPSCGLPKKNSKYAISENGSLHNCDKYHFRPEFASIENFKLCSECYTTNPSDAKYCRSCGKNIATQAIDKNGHGWVDLGLSVLWSTESLPHCFLWNDNTIIYKDHDYEELLKIKKLYKKSNCGEIGGKDAATHYWGEIWRTPTKEDFEELITKCKWEKYIIPTTNQLALKAIGPNGNSIVFPMDLLKTESKFSSWDYSLENYGFSLWSSTKESNTQAYTFHFHAKVKYISTLTAKQKKRAEFEISNEKRFKVDYFSIDELLHRRFSQRFETIEEKRRKIFPQYEMTLEQQRKILDAMGDDSHEIEHNKKTDLKRWHNLWLTTPIRITISANPNNDIAVGTMILRHRWRIPYGIRPVADKK